MRNYTTDNLSTAACALNIISISFGGILTIGLCAAICYKKYISSDKIPEIINNQNLKIGFREAKKNLSFKQLRNSCDIGLSTVIIKKDVFNSKLFRFGKTKTKEDFILWLLLAKSGIELSGMNECFVSWRKNSESLSSSNFQKIIDGYRVYRKYLQYSRTKSLFFLIILSFNFMLKKIR